MKFSPIHKIIQRLRDFRFRRRLGSYGKNVHLLGAIELKHPECLHLGSNVGIAKHCSFLPCTEYAGHKYTPKIVIGNNCWIGKLCSFAAIHGIEIGNDVLFARNVHITDHSHGYEDIDVPISKQPLISKGGVVIEDQCWLGYGCEILSGVHIGRHSVVAARAVVTKDVPPLSIVAGNPARVIKTYNKETKKWERVK